MLIPYVVTSPGRAGFDPTHPMPSTPTRSAIDDHFEPESTALRRKVHARVRMKLASRRYGAGLPQPMRETASRRSPALTPPRVGPTHSP